MFAKASTRMMLVCLGLLTITALLYLPVVRSNFITFDDPAYLIANTHVNHGLSVAGLQWAFQTNYFDYWHPLAWVSHMLDSQLFGLNPAGHHATSVLLHMLNAVLVFLVFQRLTGAFWRSATVAALFAWHPLHIESVAWVTERKDVLCAFFFLLAIWFYAGFVEKGRVKSGECRVDSASPDGRGVIEDGKGAQRAAAGPPPLHSRAPLTDSPILWHSLSLFCFVLALLSKPMAMTLPGVLLLLDFWPLQRVKARVKSEVTQGHSPLSPSLSHLLLEKVPFLLLAAGSGVWTMMVMRKGESLGSLEAFSFSARLMNVVISYVAYLKKMIWPADLALIYPRVNWSFGQEIIVAAVCFAAISWAALRQWKSRPYWLIGWLWYLGMLLPVIGFFTIGTIAMADRFTYLPLLGIFMIVVWEIHDNSGAWLRREWILGGLAGVALSGCLVMSSIQIGYWKDSTSIFVHTIKVTRNNYIAHANYAMILANQQQWEQARVESEKSIQIAPKYAWSHAALAEILLRTGRPVEAEKSARTALGLRPVVVGAYLTLGRALIQQGKMAEAGGPLAAFIKIMPQMAEGHYQYAVALAGRRQTKEAMGEYRLALARWPDSPQALNNLAWILASDSRPELRNGAEAVRLADRACEVTRNEEAVMIGTLAAACAEAGRFEEAVKLAQKAHDVALAHGEKELAAKNLSMLSLFQAKKPYRE